MTVRELTIVPIREVPLIQQGDDLPSILLQILETCEFKPQHGDVLVVTHAIVSIAEGSIFRKSDIEVSEESRRIAAQNERPPVQVEVALRQAKRVLRETPVLITETKHGFITDYSGVDESNAPTGTLMALPANPDKSANAIFRRLTEGLGFPMPIIISDTQGRPWRKGAVNVAIGVAGFSPFTENAGKKDLYGRRLRSSLVCLADEVAAAAELVMGQADEGIPLALVRGIRFDKTEGTASEIVRDAGKSLFG
ncbi:MAG: coenzyme F420-0:L-glutamate ligase [Candidatus Thorarchaeota archaeon]|jgi:coenzyme F420-0:L-glutamate ligase/coenzyme F420-1:gamma-L-glutamate ligase